MVKTTRLRHAESLERISLRSASASFERIVEQGTNCSAFEARVISDKALEVFRLGEYNCDSSLQPGQMIWQAISADEPPGKALSACVFRTVVLSVHSLREDQQVLGQYGRSAKRAQQILRMCSEAQDQGALLSQEDLATLLDCDIRTIRRDIKQLQERQHILVPTRGTKLDIGPGVTHREQAVRRFVEGADATKIARDLQHSLKSIERYIQTFCRVLYCQDQLHDTLRTAMVVGISVSLVNRYLDLRTRLCKTESYKQRIAEIEEVGSRFWQCQDEKKTDGRSRRRTK